MTIATEISADQPVGISVVADPKALSTFRDADCAGAVWQRDVPAAALDWLDALDPENLPQGRVILRPSAVRETVTHLCDLAGMAHTPHRSWLIDDIVTLADHFTALMQAPFVRLRLQAVRSNACRKFHVDGITGRLICTYRGTGTQYGTATPEGDPAQVFTLPKGTPILLRGSLWPPEPQSGLLHRSPPIEGTGETRLVLVLDPIFDPEAAD